MRIGHDYVRLRSTPTMWGWIRENPGKIWLIAGLTLAGAAFVGAGMSASLWMPALARALGAS